MKQDDIRNHFCAWRRQYGNGRDENSLRFGQWFINNFFPGLADCREIYYAESASAAYQLILCDERLVEW